MECKVCNELNDDGAVFCEMCGSKLNENESQGDVTANINKAEQDKTARILGTVSAALAGISAVSCVFTGGFSFVINVVGVVLGIFAKKKQTKPNGLTVAGIVLNALLLVMAVLYSAIFIAVVIPQIFWYLDYLI